MARQVHRHLFLRGESIEEAVAFVTNHVLPQFKKAQIEFPVVVKPPAKGNHGVLQVSYSFDA